MSLYPVFIDLRRKPCLVIGGGPVAERKVKNLLDVEALVRVVSPGLTSPLYDLFKQNRFQWMNRDYCTEDLSGAFLTFICTDNSRLNREITEECRQAGILANVVDDPANCGFLVPSVIRRDSLIVAISTQGKSPLFSRLLREELEELIPEDYGQLVEALGRMRAYIKAIIPDPKSRQPVHQLLRRPDIMNLLREGNEELAKERIRLCISSWQE